MQQTQQPQIDLSTTNAINPDNGIIWQQGYLLRKVSKFVANTTEDAVMPIPVFYDPETGKVLIDTVPKELRDELKDHLIK